MQPSTLKDLGVAGLVLLKPATLPPLASFEDGMSEGGESFDPRLGVMLDAGEMRSAIADLPALLQDFGRRGRSVFLSREAFAA